MFPILSVLGLTSGVLISTEAQAQRWLRADTKNFIVYGESSKRSLEEAATNLERIDALMRMLLNIPREENPHRLEVYVVYDQNRVGLFAGSERVAGFYRPTIEGSFIVAHRDQTDDRSIPGQVVLFHEYAHHLMFRYFTNAYPAWYREGFAEYLSTTEFTDKGFTVGAPANHRAYSIREGSYIPIADVLDPPEEGYSGSSRFMFYPQSWVLTHYLMSDPDRNRSMLQYLQMLAKGDDPVEAARESFGDLEALHDEVERYGRGRINYRRSPEPISIDGEISIRKLDDLESDLVKARFYNRVGYELDRTLGELRDLAEKYPDNPDIWIEIADAEQSLAHREEALDFTAAMEAIDRALALAPASERANLLKAQLLLEPDDHPDAELGPVDWEAVRAHAIKANEVNADNPRALYIYVDSFMREGGPVPDIAIPAMEQVFGTVPEALGARVRLARLHASAGNFDRALSLVGFMVGDPHNGERGRELVAEIEAMRDGVKPAGEEGAEEETLAEAE